MAGSKATLYYEDMNLILTRNYVFRYLELDNRESNCECNKEEEELKRLAEENVRRGQSKLGCMHRTRTDE